MPDETRLYVQLTPDAATTDYLQRLQRQVVTSGRPLPAQHLHLTIIHFGKIGDMYHDIHRESGVSRSAYDDALWDYIERSQQALPKTPIILHPHHLELFGARRSTLVLRTTSTDTLEDAHKLLYQYLRDFLRRCDIDDIDTFIVGNHNLRYAPTLIPHITLARGFTAELPAVTVEPTPLTLDIASLTLPPQ